MAGEPPEGRPQLRRRLGANRIKMSRELMLRLARAMAASEQREPQFPSAACLLLEIPRPVCEQQPPEAACGLACQEALAGRQLQQQQQQATSQVEVKTTATTTTTKSIDCDFIGRRRRIGETKAINLAKLIASYEHSTDQQHHGKHDDAAAAGHAKSSPPQTIASFLTLSLGLTEQIKAADAQQIGGETFDLRATQGGGARGAGRARQATSGTSKEHRKRASLPLCKQSTRCLVRKRRQQPELGPRRATCCGAFARPAVQNQLATRSRGKSFSQVSLSLSSGRTCCSSGLCQLSRRRLLVGRHVGRPRPEQAHASPPNQQPNNNQQQEQQQQQQLARSQTARHRMSAKGSSSLRALNQSLDSLNLLLNLLLANEACDEERFNCTVPGDDDKEFNFAPGKEDEILPLGQLARSFFILIVFSKPQRDYPSCCSLSSLVRRRLKKTKRRRRRLLLEEEEEEEEEGHLGDNKLISSNEKETPTTKTKFDLQEQKEEEIVIKRNLKTKKSNGSILKQFIETTKTTNNWHQEEFKLLHNKKNNYFAAKLNKLDVENASKFKICENFEEENLIYTQNYNEEFRYKNIERNIQDTDNELGSKNLLDVIKQEKIYPNEEKLRGRTRNEQSVINTTKQQEPIGSYTTTTTTTTTNQLINEAPSEQVVSLPKFAKRAAKSALECEQARKGRGGAQKEKEDATNCDILVDRGCWRRRSSGELGKGRRGSWLLGLSGSLLWLMLAWLLMQSSPQVSRLSHAQHSGQGSSSSPTGAAFPEELTGGGDSTSGEELSRAVLATMSTQSPISTSAEQSTRSGGLVSLSQNATTSSYFMDETGASNAEHEMMIDQQDIQDASYELSIFERPPMKQILSFLRIFIMSAIIIGDICGNSLVILSVCRHSKLRVTTNWFVVSLACADILVALFAMTFNASVIISGRWLFKGWVCDFWNSCDVLASTASILHLCCISIDRYVAIMRPLDYPMKITTRRVMYTLCGVWISSALLSYLPIFTGVYTTSEHIKWLKENPDQCEFVVNRVYAIVSSSISFWIPCCIMIFVYYRIFREATRQEKFIYKAQAMMPAPVPNHHQQHHHHHHHHHHHSNHHSSSGGGNNSSNSSKTSKQRRSKSVAVANLKHEMQSKKPTLIRPTSGKQSSSGTTQTSGVATTNLTASTASIPASSEQVVGSSGGSNSEPTAAAERANLLDPQAAAAASALAADNAGAKLAALPAQPIREEDEEEEADDDEDSNSGQSTPTNRSISKMKREHKAAKTLGIIMGVFILCWLPFFSWYTPTQICGRACDGMVPKQAVTILFWIGYFNSTLNPIIYAYFNHEFRDAFKKTLQWIFCCCSDLKCLRVNRPNDNQHYNCTYRSTQEIGLVNS